MSSLPFRVTTSVCALTITHSHRSNGGVHHDVSVLPVSGAIIAQSSSCGVQCKDSTEHLAVDRRIQSPRRAPSTLAVLKNSGSPLHSRKVRTPMDYLDKGNILPGPQKLLSALVDTPTFIAVPHTCAPLRQRKRPDCSASLPIYRARVDSFKSDQPPQQTATSISPNAKNDERVWRRKISGGSLLAEYRPDSISIIEPSTSLSVLQ